MVRRPALDASAGVCTSGIGLVVLVDVDSALCCIQEHTLQHMKDPIQWRILSLENGVQYFLVCLILLELMLMRSHLIHGASVHWSRKLYRVSWVRV